MGKKRLRSERPATRTNSAAILSSILAEAVLPFLKDIKGATTWSVRHLTDVLKISRREAEQVIEFLGARGYVEAEATELLAAVREQQFEGIVRKRTDSPYEPQKCSGAWIKYRINRGQEFATGGYFLGRHGFDSLIVGYYDGDELMDVARTRNGFVPASRRQVFSKLKV
jgi:ATP-dependent DNA ligase